MEKICPACNRAFETPNKRKVCCCGACVQKYWVMRNKSKFDQYMDRYRVANKEYLYRYRKEYKQQNKEILQQKAHHKWLENKDTIMEQRRNDPKFKAAHDKASKAWKQRNKQRIIDRANERYKNDVGFRLKAVLRARLRVAVKNNHKAGSAVRDLGCSIEFFKTYLEALFLPEMTWDNHGEWDPQIKRWHIDHIVPLDSFDLSDPEQLKQACHYTNLRPLWAIDNCSKGSKVSC